jgi:adenosylcobinamide-GDP ribazoletransferase
MSGFFVALSFLTRLPVPPLAPEKAGSLALAAPWLPAAGAMVGLLVAVFAALGASLGPWVGALLALLAWVAVSGGLHLDGLGDVADGLGAAHGNPQRFVEVARDPHTGSFGTIAIALQIAAKLVLLAAVIEALGVKAAAIGILLIAVWARWGTLALGRAVPPLTEGMASRLAAGISTRVVVLEGAALALATAFLMPVLLTALPVTLALALYWRVRLGGITGDCHGASIEITESALLFALLLA